MSEFLQKFTDRRTIITLLFILVAALSTYSGVGEKSTQLFAAENLPNTLNTLTGQATQNNELETTETDTVNLQKGLQGYWRFDNPKVSRGYSLEFDGSDDVVNISNSAELKISENITISAWVRSDKSSGAVLTKGGEPETYSMGLKTGNVFFFREQSDGTNRYLTSQKTVKTKEWTHIVARDNGNEMSVFINGQKDSNTINSTGWQAGTDNSPLYMAKGDVSGSGSSNQGGWFKGGIENLKIYSKPLPNSQIKDLYNEMTVSRESLVLYQDFNEGPNSCDFTSGSSCLSDDSKYSNSGTPQNFNDNNLATGSGWIKGTPINRPSVKDYSSKTHSGVFYGGNNGQLRNFDFNASSGWTKGKIGETALETDGFDDEVEASSTDKTGAVSVSVWFKLSNESSDWQAVVSDNWQTFYMGISPNSGEIGWHTRNDSGQSHNAITRDVSLNEWHHAVGVISQEKDVKKFYVDGVKVGESTISDFGDIKGKICMASKCGADFFNGSIDDIRIYNRALSKSRVKSLYRGESVIKGLIGRWNFEAGDRKKAYDTSIRRKGVLDTPSAGFDSSGSIRDSQNLNIGEEVTVSAWVDNSEARLGTKENPGISCNHIYSTGYSQGDGVYWIDPDGPGGNSKYKAFCKMTLEGGWTLMMKGDGESGVFNYSASYWTSNNTLNPDSNSLSTSVNAKFRSYNDLKISRVRAKFPDNKDHGMTENVEEHFGEPQRAINIFAGEKIIGHEDYNGGDVSPPCEENAGIGRYGDYWYNYEGETNENNADTIFAHQCGWQDYGFDILKSGYAGDGVRWGWFWNNEADSYSSSDAIAGIGMDASFGVGAHVTCCASKPDGDYPRDFLIWGQNSGNWSGPGISKPGSFSFYFGNQSFTGSISGTKTMAKSIQGWSQYAMTYDQSSGKVKLYRQGELVESKSIGKNLQLIDKNLNIGKHFVGRIDEVRVYNRSLSEKEVQQLAFQ